MTRPIEDLVWEIRRLFRELGRAGDQALAPLGMTAAERALLEFLAREEAPATLSEIARKRTVSRQHVHQTLARLNPRWVNRSSDPQDARSVALSLTAEGRAVWRRIRALDERFFRALEKELDEKKVRAVTATLRSVRDVIGSVLEHRE